MEYRKVISGEDKSIAAAIVRLFLLLLSGPYRLAVGFRNLAYDKGWLKSHKLSVPVISVGNITAGGTGKTPFVIWLCRFLLEEGFKPAILTRGYKGKPGVGNDETLLVQQALPDVPIVVHSDRVAGGREAIEEHQVDVLVLDDGFQHRKLERDHDIVLIDATCPFGHEKVLPGGYLREDPEELRRRAHTIILSRCEQVSPDRITEIEKKLAGVLHLKPNYRCEFVIRGVSNQAGEKLAKSELSARFYAFSGIGNPGSFMKTIEHMGFTDVCHKFFPDHHIYSVAQVADLLKQADRAGAKWLVTTEKDWVKMDRLDLDPDVRAKIVRVQIELRIIENDQGLGEQDFKETILGVCRKQDVMNPST